MRLRPEKDQDMKGLRRYFQSPLHLALAGLVCFGAGALAAKLFGESGLLFWWPAFAFMVLAIAIRFSGVQTDSGSPASAFDDFDQRTDTYSDGWLFGTGPDASHYVGNRSYDISNTNRD